MRITASGNVGIGTTSPTAKIGIGGSAGNKINWYETGNNYKFLTDLENYSTNQYNLRFGMPGYLGRIFQFGTISTVDGTTYSPLMTILGNGNVGIGTATPSQKLHVAGNIMLNGAIIDGTGTRMDSNGGWFRTYGTTGWYNGTYG